MRFSDFKWGFFLFVIRCIVFYHSTPKTRHVKKSHVHGLNSQYLPEKCTPPSIFNSGFWPTPWPVFNLCFQQLSSDVQLMMTVFTVFHCILNALQIILYTSPVLPLLWIIRSLWCCGKSLCFCGLWLMLSDMTTKMSEKSLLNMAVHILTHPSFISFSGHRFNRNLDSSGCLWKCFDSSQQASSSHATRLG